MRRRFTALLLVTALGSLILGASLVFAKGVPANDLSFADIRAVMQALGASDQDVQAVAEIALTPGNVEYINPYTGVPPNAAPAVLDPQLTVTTELAIPNIAQLASPGGPLAAGSGPLGTVYYGQGLTNPTGTEWYMYAKVLSQPCVHSGLREYGFAAYDTTPSDGSAARRYTPQGATQDLFYGMNTAYVLHAEPGGVFAAQRYLLGSPGAQPAFATTDSNWMGICFNDTVVGLIPGDEWDGITELRFFGFDVPYDGEQPRTQDAVQMRFPNITDDPIFINADQPVIDIGPEATVAPTQTPAPTVALTQAPTTGQPSTPAPTSPPTTTTGGGGTDPVVLLALAGITLVGLGALLWFGFGGGRSSQYPDCDDLLAAWRRAQAACDAATKAADAAWQRYIDASKAARSAEAAERAAQDALKKAQADLAAAEARAQAEPSGWVEGEPYGKITTDDLALQREANAAARADADAAKQSALDAWHAAGSPQGDAWAKVDDQLSAIEQTAQAGMAHNNDPANLPELRKAAAAKAKAQMDGLKAAVDGAQKALDDAHAAMLNAQENESVVGAAANSAKADADRACAEADAARKAYEACVGQAQAAAEAKAKTAVPPPPPPPVTPDPSKTGDKGLVVPPPPAGNPPARACHDGDESWEPVGKPRGFAMRADGAKTRVTIWSDPGITGLTQWIKDSASASGREDGEAHPSITSGEFPLIPGQLGGWLRGQFGASSTAPAVPVDLNFEIKRKHRTIQCERRWVCQNGQWQPRETRAQVTDESLPSTKLTRNGVEPTQQKIQGFLNECQRLIDDLKKQEDEAEQAARCE